jgi:enoyl-CoA hydratase/carnithine racemase
MMVSGRNVKAPEAMQLGIIDELAPRPFASHDDIIANASAFILSDRYVVVVVLALTRTRGACVFV